MKSKNISPLNFLVNFFASIYDLAIVVFESLVHFFASIYDVSLNFIIFLGEYVKWLTTIKPNNLESVSKEVSQIHNQNPFHLR